MKYCRNKIAYLRDFAPDLMKFAGFHNFSAGKRHFNKPPMDSGLRRGAPEAADAPAGRPSDRQSLFSVLHGKLGYGGKGSNDEEEVIIIPIAVANPLSDFDFVVEALELAGADRERSM